MHSSGRPQAPFQAEHTPWDPRGGLCQLWTKLPKPVSASSACGNKNAADEGWKVPPPLGLEVRCQGASPAEFGFTDG